MKVSNVADSDDQVFVSELELAWKIEGTQSYQELTRRSLATMRETIALPVAEADRRRIQVGELLPLSTLKRRD